jgi:hypothetical protein
MRLAPQAKVAPGVIEKTPKACAWSTKSEGRQAARVFLWSLTLRLAQVHQV